MPVGQKLKPKTRELYLSGLSPQQAIRKLQDMITHTPEPYKRWLRIEEYRETYDHPFSDGEIKLRLVCYKPNLMTDANST